MVLLVSFFVFFTSLQFYLFSKTTLASKTWVYPLIAAKIFIALSMGHLDIYRFIVFILNFVNHPQANPWDYSLMNSMADFPYPPVLLYLQSLPFFIAQNFFDSSWFQQVLPEHYVLIRIPFLLFDSWLLWKLARSNADSKLVQIIWCSPLLIFHQFYSGQLDWVAIIPFIFFVQDFIHRSKINFCSFFFLTLSLSLKPFALIFLPLMAIFLIKRPQQIFWLFMAVVVYKISELPFAVTDSYKKLMGAGSVMLEASSPVFQVPLFYILYVFLMGMLWYYRKKLDLAHALFYAMAFLTTAIPWVARFSAGWMAWIFIPMQLLYSEKLIGLSDRKKISNFFWLWQFFFVLEWTFVSHSPFFDSLSVFLKTLGFETKLDMGFFYNVISKEFSLTVAQKLDFLGHFLFGVASLIFFVLLLKSFLRFTKARLL